MTSAPQPSTATVAPPAASAPRCAAESTPRARPLTIDEPARGEIARPAARRPRARTATPAREPTIATAGALERRRPRRASTAPAADRRSPRARRIRRHRSTRSASTRPRPRARSSAARRARADVERLGPGSLAAGASATSASRTCAGRIAGAQALGDDRASDQSGSSERATRSSEIGHGRTSAARRGLDEKRPRHRACAGPDLASIIARTSDGRARRPRFVNRDARNGRFARSAVAHGLLAALELCANALLDRRGESL